MDTVIIAISSSASKYVSLYNLFGLNVAGTEALFADLGHFSYRSIQVKTTMRFLLASCIVDHITL